MTSSTVYKQKQNTYYHCSTSTNLSIKPYCDIICGPVFHHKTLSTTSACNICFLQPKPLNQVKSFLKPLSTDTSLTLNTCFSIFYIVLQPLCIHPFHHIVFILSSSHVLLGTVSRLLFVKIPVKTKVKSNNQ